MFYIVPASADSLVEYQNLDYCKDREYSAEKGQKRTTEWL